MKRHALALPVLLACVACARQPVEERVAVPPPGATQAAAAAAPAVVAPVAEGDTTLAVGQVLEIALEGNASTGHAWEVVADGAPQLARQPLPDVPVDAPPPAGPAMVGMPGIERWRFRAEQPGAARLHLVYRRPWEEGVAPAKEAVFEVVVAGDAD